MGNEACKHGVEGGCIGCETPLEKLRKILPEGSTIHYSTVHVARSGMSATLAFHHFYFVPCVDCNGTGRDGPISSPRDAVHTACITCGGRRGEIRDAWLSRMIANADLGRWDDRNEGIRIGGAGFNRGQHVISNLARALYGREDALKMERL